MPYPTVCVILIYEGAVRKKVKQYRIGQFAKMMGVSLDFIRFYEEKGLIRSTVDPNNNYHYYDISQSDDISRIQLYRKLGFNVKEIKALLHNANKEQMIQMLSSRSDAFSDNLKTTTYSIQYLEYLKSALSTENGTWYITNKPAIWFLPHTLNDNYLEDPETVSAYKIWNEQIPLIYRLDRWSLEENGRLKSINHGRAIEKTIAEAFDLHPDPPFLFYPEKRCIEYYMENEHTRDANAPPPIGLRDIQPALNVAKEKQFDIDGDIFFRPIAFYKEGNRQFSKSIIYIPIK